MTNLIAQIQTNIGNEPLKGIGPLGIFAKDSAPSLFNNVLSKTIGLLTVIAGVWFLIQLIIGAIGLITSSGDKASIAAARQRITTGLIGLIVVISAIFIAGLIGGLLGIDILNPANFIETVSF